MRNRPETALLRRPPRSSCRCVSPSSRASPSITFRRRPSRSSAGDELLDGNAPEVLGRLEGERLVGDLGSEIPAREGHLRERLARYLLVDDFQPSRQWLARSRNPDPDLNEIIVVSKLGALDTLDLLPPGEPAPGVAADERVIGRAVDHDEFHETSPDRRSPRGALASPPVPFTARCPRRPGCPAP